MIEPVAPSELVLAERLWQAAQNRRACDPLTKTHPELDLAGAYRIQAELLAFRTARGERVVGAKLGFTTAAMRNQMNVDSPNYGWLTDRMVIPGDVVDLTTFIHPRVEPEICFILGASLRGPGVAAEDAIAATSRVAPALEVVDSRFKDYAFTAADNTADNSSAAGVRIGVELAPAGLDLRGTEVVLERNGEPVGRATGGAALGDPAAAVAWLANELSDAPRALEPGDIVITGGLTAAPYLTDGDRFVAQFDVLGSVTLRGSVGSNEMVTA